METLFVTPLLMLQVVLLIIVIFFDLTRRNRQLVWLYALQSLAVAQVLLFLGWRDHSWVLFAIVGATLIIKCIVAPKVFFNLLKKHDLVFTSSAHVNTPVMLGLILLLVIVVNSSITPLFARVIPGEGEMLFLSISAFFVSLFFTINRRGAFSQVIGILSAENCLVVIAALMNIHVELWLELGILADIFAWILIGSTFISVVSKHFGTTDVSVMKELAE